jgi:hypothetical protein
MHSCNRYLVRTDNKPIKTNAGKTFYIYICEDCKRYYIRNGRVINEVVYNNKELRWERV